MPRPKKIKSPEDFGKEFEKLKITKPTPYDNMPCGNPYIEEREVEEDEQAIHAKDSKHNEIGGGITIFGDRETTEKVVAKLGTEEQFDKIYNEVTDTNVGKSPLEELQELEKKLRACTTETPRDIRYKIECNRFILVLQYNSIEVRGDVFYPEMLKGIYIDSRKSELATAHKMHEVLKEWRGE